MRIRQHPLLYGDADSGLAGRKADIEGFAITGGIDKTIGTDAIIGGMISYSSSDNTMDSGMGDAEISGASVGLYGYVPFENRVFVDGHVSYGSYSVDMSRTAQLVGGTLAATGDTNADQLLVGASVGREYQFNNGINVTAFGGPPSCKLRYRCVLRKRQRDPHGRRIP